MTGTQHQSTGTPPSNDESGAARINISSKDQDRFVPIANVSRIMKKSLPPNAKISKEAKEIVQECVSQFISFVTGEASDKCQREKRKTINGDDLLWSMTTLGFENYVEPLKVYLSKFGEIEGEKSSITRQSDQFAIEECGSDTSNSFNHGVNTNNPNLSGFYNRFYPLVTPAIPPSFEGEEKG